MAPWLCVKDQSSFSFSMLGMWFHASVHTYVNICVFLHKDSCRVSEELDV